MTSDRIRKYNGTNDQASKKKGEYQTKAMIDDKNIDDKMRSTVENKCNVMACPNQYDYKKTWNTFCSEHQQQ